MSATSSTPETRREADFYPTPDWCVRSIVPHVIGRMPVGRSVIYDAGAGDGAILRGFHAAGYPIANLRGCDLRADAAERCRAQGFMVWDQNWLDTGPAVTGDIGAVVMNPPYGGRDNTAQKFVECAVQRLHGGASVWALLRLNWLLDGQATFGRTDWLRDGPGMPDVFGLPRRPSFTGDGKADATTYAWMRWVVGAPRLVTTFRIIDYVGAPVPAATPELDIEARLQQRAARGAE